MAVSNAIIPPRGVRSRRRPMPSASRTAMTSARAEARRPRWWRAVAAGIEANDAVAGFVERRDHRVPGPQSATPACRRTSGAPDPRRRRRIRPEPRRDSVMSPLAGDRLQVDGPDLACPARLRANECGRDDARGQFSITAASPAKPPPPAILTRSPTDGPTLPLPALRSIVAVERTYGASGPAPRVVPAVSVGPG